MTDNQVEADHHQEEQQGGLQKSLDKWEWELYLFSDIDIYWKKLSKKTNKDIKGGLTKPVECSGYSSQSEQPHHLKCQAAWLKQLIILIKINIELNFKSIVKLKLLFQIGTVALPKI